MIRTDQDTHDGFSHISNEEVWPGVDSRYRLIVVAALRSKQLLRGATSRIEADTQRRKNTSIAIEEVKRGLVPFTIISPGPEDGVPDTQPPIGEVI
jgi:DNA-directed RNA polymerase omega subunit